MPGYLKARAEKQGQTCVAEARSALSKVVQVVDRALQDHQKTITRKLTPHVQSQLLEGYKEASEQRGPGSVKRQKVRICLP